MTEVKDPTIKLFGKTISLPLNKVAGDDHRQEQRQQVICLTVLDNKITTRGNLSGSTLESDMIKTTEDESMEPETPSRDSETPKSPAAVTETLSSKFTKTEEPSPTSVSEEKTLKKPDEILPCARCNSMDTKFCYYNNYNVKQPRHFCKNCQRYWTAGGTMRNVRVGSGRRKNKSNYAPESDGTVIAFSSERLLSESMASELHLSERAHALIPNGFRGTATRLPMNYGEIEMTMDHLNGPYCLRMELSRSQGQGNPGSIHQETVRRINEGYASQTLCFPGTPLPCQWDAARYRSPESQHDFDISCFPVSIYPASPLSSFTAPIPWNVQFPTTPSYSTNQPGMTTNPLSPLRKRHRDGAMLKLNSNKGMFIDIDVPSHATGKNHVADTSLLLHANPAGFSRSVNFQESA